MAEPQASNRDGRPMGCEMQPGLPPAWKTLIVDDEEQVHRVTTMALMDVTFDDRPLEFFSAYSEAEARRMLKQHPDLALILLDVVMETDDAGLRLVEYIREELGNKDVRIVIRTGQPGLAPERAVVAKYDINGFREKTELTIDKLFSTVYTALSSYRDLHALREEVTRRRQVEKLQIQQTSELEKANRSLREFATLAAHDMKEPLRKIVIFTERLENRMAGNLAPEVKEYAERVKEDALRLINLIEALQKLAAIDASKPNMEKLDLKQAIEKVLCEYALNLQQAGAVVECETLPTIEADRTSMEVLFQNLISNALKYASPDRPLKMKFSSHPAINEDRGVGRYCEIHAQDNGIGIDPKYTEKIFETFYRLHGKEIAGTGVGLTLCKQLLKLHQGDIRVESRPGEGSTFIMTLPIQQS